MTYSLLVNRDAPIGYWQLTSSSAQSGSVSASVTSPAYTLPPIVSNTPSAMIVKPSGASVAMVHVGDALYTNFENRTLDLNFWFSFNGLFDGSGYTKNLSASSQYYANNLLKIVDIVTNTGTEIGYVAYDYTRNTFRFSIIGSGNTDAFYVVKNLNTAFFIRVVYNDHKLSISVNGDPGINGYVNTTTNFPTKPSGSVIFNINGNSIKSASTTGFVISDIATYDYELVQYQVRDRIIWASNYDKPSMMTGPLGTSFFDIYEDYGHMTYYDDVEGIQFKDRTADFNVVVDSIYGLTVPTINNMITSNYSSTAATVSFTASGVQTTGSAILEFPDFGKTVNNANSFSLTAQVIYGGTQDYVLSFNDSTNDNTYYIKSGSTSFVFGAYNISSSVQTPIATVNGTFSTGSSYNVGLGAFNGSVTFWAGSSSATATASNLYIPLESTLYALGNPNIPSSAPTTVIKNLGVSSLPILRFDLIDFTKNNQFMARLTTDYTVSRVGWWVKRIPLANFGLNISGVRITWDAMDNCLVETSINGGNTWTTLTRNSPIPGFAYNTLAPDLYIRVTVPYEYTPEADNQTFSGINIIVYGDQKLLSTDSKYYINAGADSASAFSYNIQAIDQPINLRRNMFGLNFSTTGAGYAQIIPTSSAFQPYGIEFYTRLASLSGSTQWLLDGATASSRFALQLTPSGSLTTISSSATLYINGASVTGGVFVPQPREFYHVMVDFGGQYSGSSIAINGLVSGQHAFANFGYIHLWNNPITASQASARFNHYTSNNIVQIVDTNTRTWQPNWPIDTITSGSGYKIG